MLPATPDFRRARSNTPADFVVFELKADLATDVTQDKPFRELLQLIAQLYKPASAGVVKRVDQGPKLGLTTAPRVSTVLENRDREVKSLETKPNCAMSAGSRLGNRYTSRCSSTWLASMSSR